ncbi:ankyrin-3-like [Bufo bufo]|uniref:ankyrin-3-like n=1 Tax=Bufo bufo TaxID=8384 RepID=UPI001ABE3D99|nr:ankyrin-3-like [Bufo bufo]
MPQFREFDDAVCCPVKLRYVSRRFCHERPFSINVIWSFTGKSLRRFDSFDGLTQQQIITRVEWFVTEMKNYDVLPKNASIDCKSIALQKPEHVLNLLLKLVSHDLLFTWERSSQLMHLDDKVVCSVPFKWTPEIQPSVKQQPKLRSVSSLLDSLDALTNRTEQPSLEEHSSQDSAVWKAFPGHEVALGYKKDILKGRRTNDPNPEQCALQMVNALLKEASKDTISEISRLEDLVHTNVICSLVNYFLPHTFAIQIILDDRWAVNVALKTLEKLLFITSSFSCDDLTKGDLQAVCAYVCFICMAGFKYKQSRSVVNYNKQLSFRTELAMSRLKIFSSENLELNQFAEKNDLQQKVIEMKNANIRKLIHLPLLESAEVNPEHYQDYEDTVLLLLENGASLNKRDRNNHKALYYAMRGQHRDICQLLIEWGGRVWDQSSGQLSPSTSKHNLKEFCKEYSERWKTAVSRILKGDTGLLKRIVEDQETGKSTMASLRSRCIDGSTLLHVAAYFGEEECVETLLKLHIDTDVVDYKGATPLQRSRDAKTMQMLRNYGADVNWKDDDGNTALHMVCYGEPGQPTRMDSLQFLLSHKASTRKYNKKGLLPIHCAAIQGRTDILQALTEFAPKEREHITEHLTKRDIPSLPYLALTNGHLESAKCPLHLAACHVENYEILALLLSCSAEVNALNKDLITPLFNATNSSNFHGAKLLIDYGANLEYQDERGLTAFDHIKNIDDWIACGLFGSDINELLRAYDLRQSIQLVRQVADRMKTMEAI